MFRVFTSFCVLFLSLLGNLSAKKIGLLIVATGQYDQFVDPLIESARQHFLNGHEVTYFVFTDGTRVSRAKDVVSVLHKKLGWPFDTMMRNEVYCKNKKILEDQDYLFALDADMRFVDAVGDEILGERVATLHPGFIDGKRGTYETNSKSKAYVSKKEGKLYFAGGFFGGSKKEFFKIINQTTSNIHDDLSQGIIAIWHDESHWNRYCIDHPPTVVLNPSYCYPESWELDFPKKLLALDKNHDKIRK